MAQVVAQAAVTPRWVVQVGFCLGRLRCAATCVQALVHRLLLLATVKSAFIM
jgi:hypothetical protein